MKVKFNEERASQVFSILNSLWMNKEEIFKGVILPQERWPLPEDLKDKANYLFYAALPMRGGVVSDDPFKIFSTLYKESPCLFKPEFVAKELSPSLIAEDIKRVAKELKIKEILLRSNGESDVEESKKDGKEKGGALGYKLTEHAEHWYENSVVLERYWGGNILNVFKYGITDFEDAFRSIDWKKSKAGFCGMRRKIFALLTIWLQEEELIPVFPTPLPVDFHALRILWATECIAFSKNTKPPKALGKYYPALVGNPAIRISEPLQDAIALWSQKFLAQKELSHLNINPAIWVLSRDFCQGQFQNISKNKGKIFFTAENLRSDPTLWPKKYRNPCNFCPLEHLCSGAIPANPYFRKGIIVRMERIPYHSPLLLQDIFYSGRRRSIPNNTPSSLP